FPRNRGRLSGPIRDRVDLNVAMPRQRVSALFDDAAEEPSVRVRARIEAARARQLERSRALNASLSGPEIRARCRLGSGGRRLLAQSGERLHLSARASSGCSGWREPSRTSAATPWWATTRWPRHC